MSKVIVVDDDFTNVGLIKMLLELDGFTVSACTDIEQAYQAATGADAFVIDINLSRGTNGLDLLRAIRAGQTAAQPNTVVIMSSGDYRRDTEALEAGANQFLLKPYPPQSLTEALSQFLSKGQPHE